jgi:hypothetical protein
VVSKSSVLIVGMKGNFFSHSLSGVFPFRWLTLDTSRVCLYNCKLCKENSERTLLDEGKITVHINRTNRDVPAHCSSKLPYILKVKIDFDLQ